MVTRVTTPVSVVQLVFGQGLSQEWFILTQASLSLWPFVKASTVYEVAQKAHG